MQRIITIAKKEYLDAIKNKLFLVLLVFLLVLTVTSLVVVTFDFPNKVMEYNKALKVLQNAGRSTAALRAPELAPLKMLRGVIDYLEIIGAIIGIILGYLSIAKEKGRNVLQLILSRPVSRFDITSGKVVGNSLLVLSVLAGTTVATYLIMWYVSGQSLSLVEMEKLGLVYIASYLYIMFFFCLTSVLALKFKTLPNALIVSLVIWLAFVLIIPQVGDTMDPDNQIPGGFFTSMNLTKPQEERVMAKFSTYEKVRNALEESSITKHYERLSFALLGIKNKYDKKPLGAIFKDMWPDSVWVLLFFSAMLITEYIVFRKSNFMLA